MQGPSLPEEGEYLYDWFQQLEQFRTYNAFSGHPEPIAPERIEAWARLTGRVLEPIEVEGLLLLDLASRNPAEPEKE